MIDARKEKYLKEIESYGHHSPEEVALIRGDLEKGYPLECVSFYGNKKNKSIRHDYMRRFSHYMELGIKDVRILELLDECLESEALTEYILKHFSKVSVEQLREDLAAYEEAVNVKMQNVPEGTAENKEEAGSAQMPVPPALFQNRKGEREADAKMADDIYMELIRLLHKKEEMIQKKDERIECLEDQKSELLKEKELLVKKPEQTAKTATASFSMEEKDRLVKGLNERDEKIMNLTVELKSMQAENAFLKERIEEIKTDYEALRELPMEEIRKYNGLIEMLEKTSKENMELKQRLGRAEISKEPDSSSEKGPFKEGIWENRNPPPRQQQDLQDIGDSKDDGRKMEAPAETGSRQKHEAPVRKRNLTDNRKRHPEPEQKMDQPIDCWYGNMVVEKKEKPKRNSHKKAFFMKMVKPDSFLGVMLQRNATPEQMEILQKGMEEGLSVRQAERLLESGRSGEVLERLVRIAIFDSKRKG